MAAERVGGVQRGWQVGRWAGGRPTSAPPAPPPVHHTSTHAHALLPHRRPQRGPQLFVNFDSILSCFSSSSPDSCFKLTPPRPPTALHNTSPVLPLFPLARWPNVDFLPAHRRRLQTPPLTNPPSSALPAMTTTTPSGGGSTSQHDGPPASDVPDAGLRSLNHCALGQYTAGGDWEVLLMRLQTRGRCPGGGITSARERCP